MINTIEIRKLNIDDANLIEKMETGIENDYVLRVFPRLTEGNNHLFGLFVEEELAVVGGFTIYQNSYAMLGRLRSDIKFRGRNLATELNNYLIEKAFEMDQIQWVGANTQDDNTPAKRVLEKLGFPQLVALHGAITDDLNPLLEGHNKWKEIYRLEEKKAWIKKGFIDNKYIFPYECYYPFPSSWDLFEDEEVSEWRFFENEEENRFFLLKTDQKRHRYLHLVYPYDDLHEQVGICETVQAVYEKMEVDPELETYIWVDLTKEEAARLPRGHEFKLPSPWVLHGMTRDDWEKMR